MIQRELSALHTILPLRSETAVTAKFGGNTVHADPFSAPNADVLLAAETAAAA